MRLENLRPLEGDPLAFAIEHFQKEESDSGPRGSSTQGRQLRRSRPHAGPTGVYIRVNKGQRICFAKYIRYMYCTTVYNIYLRACNGYAAYARTKRNRFSASRSCVTYVCYGGHTWFDNDIIDEQRVCDDFVFFPTEVIASFYPISRTWTSTSRTVN